MGDELKAAVEELKQWVNGPGDLKDDAEKASLALTLARYEVVRSRPGAALAELRKAIAKLEPGSKAAGELFDEYNGGPDLGSTSARSRLYLG